MARARPRSPTSWPARRPTCSRRAARCRPGSAGDLAPHGTTIVAATFPGGVVMAGDRRATMGNVIAQRDIEKVFPADEFSVRRHRRLRGPRGRDGAAVPDRARALREDRGHHAVDGRQGQPAGRADPRQPRAGHAGPRRRAAVRRLRPRPPARAGSSATTSPADGTRRPPSTRSAPARCSPAAPQEALPRRPRAESDCVTAIVQALYDAADDDSATGGPDLTRRIFPVVHVITADGGRRLPDDEVAAIADRMIAAPDAAPRRPGRGPV